MKPSASPCIHPRKKTIQFCIQNVCASHVSLSGSFNHWAHDALAMKAGRDGVWRIEIPMLPKGKYHYKFFVDDKMWTEDINNPNREPDGVTGFNSILTV